MPSQIAIATHDDEPIVGQVCLEDIAQTSPDELAAARAYWQARSEAFQRAFSPYQAHH